eukprot:12913375-Prorocentrum_lima.AAC.1
MHRAGSVREHRLPTPVRATVTCGAAGTMVLLGVSRVATSRETPAWGSVKTRRSALILSLSPRKATRTRAFN